VDLRAMASRSRLGTIERGHAGWLLLGLCVVVAASRIRFSDGSILLAVAQGRRVASTMPASLESMKRPRFTSLAALVALVPPYSWSRLDYLLGTRGCEICARGAATVCSASARTGLLRR
jgi:hypothetical protein